MIAAGATQNLGEAQVREAWEAASHKERKESYDVFKKGQQKGTKGDQLPARATVMVRMPVDAHLYVDGQWANLSSAERTFTTPELQPGNDYYYSIRAEAVRNGQTVMQ